MLTSVLKPKVCAYEKCGREFMPARPMQQVCSPVCAGRMVRARSEAQKRADRELDKKRREAVKTRSQLKSEAQDSFNDYIRYRDIGLPCVSCGDPDPPMTPGGQWDAGHFKSRGSHPELAFDEDNCWRQCKACNGGSAYTKTNERVVSARYEEELTRRIGPERVARLNGPHPPLKFRGDDFRELRDTYRAKLRELKKEKA